MPRKKKQDFIANVPLLLRDETVADRDAEVDLSDLEAEELDALQEAEAIRAPGDPRPDWMPPLPEDDEAGAEATSESEETDSEADEDSAKED